MHEEIINIKDLTRMAEVKIIRRYKYSCGRYKRDHESIVGTDLV